MRWETVWFVKYTYQGCGNGVGGVHVLAENLMAAHEMAMDAIKSAGHKLVEIESVARMDFKVFSKAK